MGNTNQYVQTGVISVLCVVILLVLGFVGGATALQAINVEGDFEGDFVGYAEDQDEQSHLIEIEGEFTFTGEDAENVEVRIESGSETVLKQGSVEPFVEGDRSVPFDQTERPGSTLLAAEESVPSGTTIQLSFETILVGGSETDEISAGEVTVSYETRGGTPGDQTFDLPTDVSDSADNRLGTLQSEVDSLEQWRTIGIAGAAVAIVMLIVTIVLYLKCCRDDNGQPKPGNEQPGGGSPPGSGGPP